MKKLSKINEGLWKSGIERSRKGDIRREDELQTNIRQLHEIDLGVSSCVFADDDLDIEEETKMTPEKFYKKYYEKILKTGWRLPTVDEMDELFDTGIEKEYEIKDNTGKELTITFKSPTTNKFIDFNVERRSHYDFMTFDKDEYKNLPMPVTVFRLFDPVMTETAKSPVIGISKSLKVFDCHIRLVKDKK